ncbi:hypothetical protein H8958_021075 [Nasalis larvatus]
MTPEGSIPSCWRREASLKPSGLSFRTSFLEPTTHEILSTFIPSEGSSSKVEESVAGDSSISLCDPGGLWNVGFRPL